MTKSKKGKSRHKELHPHHYFYMVNGAVVRDIDELVGHLRDVDYNTFFHHVNENKNDFASWIRDCIGDVKLADTVSGHKTKEDIVNAVSSRIAELEKEENKLIRKLYHSLTHESPKIIREGAGRIASMHKAAYKATAGRLYCRLAKMFTRLCEDTHKN